MAQNLLGRGTCNKELLQRVGTEQVTGHLATHHQHHHHFRLFLSADTRNLIYMSKQYRPTCNEDTRTQEVQLTSAIITTSQK